VTVFEVPRSLLAQTFNHFRQCGGGRRECQVLWISAWDAPQLITEVVHPKHKAAADHFILDDHWLNAFWLELASAGTGVRFQVHTHGGEAFHSRTDDLYPIIHNAGFLSLVIPSFGLGPVGFDRAYLTEIVSDGTWREVQIASRVAIV
jgi:hypothetical protein